MKEASVPFSEFIDRPAQAQWREVLGSGTNELVSNYVLTQAVFAFVDSGLAARIDRKAPTPRARLVEGLNAELANGLLRFLTVRGILSASPDATSPDAKFSFTQRGGVMTDELAFSLVGFYREAYGPVFDRMSDLIRNTARYPKDVQRNGGALGRHSAGGFHHFGTPVALDCFRRLGAHSVLDLGCGAGAFLIDACRALPELRAYGLDISADAIDIAQKLVDEAGLSDRIKLYVGDAFQPESWPKELREVEAVISVGTVHEHFRDGEDAVIALINKYADAGVRGLILGEPELEVNEKDADFFLAHVFTLQGLPRDHNGWLPVLARSKMRCEAVVTAPDVGPRFSYFILKPR